MAVSSKDSSLLEKIMPDPRHKWLITVDHRATMGAKSMTGNLAGCSGPYGMCGLPVPLPDTFRLLDGEGRTLYEGKTNAGTLAASKNGIHNGLEPLKEIGRGAVYIEYLINDRWLRPKGSMLR
jgi:hypothetical protein